MVREERRITPSACDAALLPVRANLKHITCNAHNTEKASSSAMASSEPKLAAVFLQSLRDGEDA